MKIRIAWIFWVAVFTRPTLTMAGYQLSEEAALCVDCHESNEEITYGDGTKKEISLFLDVLANSVHEDNDCSDCHTGYANDAQHPGVATYPSRRVHRELTARICRDCHEPDAGIHGRMMESLNSLTCIDCHGGHDVQPVPPANTCMGCHQYRLLISIGAGRSEKISVHPDDVALSVHHDLDCIDCHGGFTDRTHPQIAVEDRRGLSLRLADTCKNCHFDKYTRGLEDIHYALHSAGEKTAPVCTDCHGAHDVSYGQREKRSVAKRCDRCHHEIYQAYAASVHGSAMRDGNNPDVPTCSDCHTAHTIGTRAGSGFRDRIPEMCGSCHSDPQIMTRYGLSTNVVDSYLQDFHGVTLNFYRQAGEDVRHIAVCSDCHGIHDISSTRAAAASAFKVKVAERCRRCHPGATDDFPDAWVSHYEPTFRRAPLVYAVTVFYEFLIPFMIAGLGLQIALHLWRHAVHR